MGQLDDTQRKIIHDNEAKGAPLERYKKTAKAFLKEKGYKRNSTYLSMEIAYKMLATLAGIGWIGKCVVLVSDKVGSALRFTAVLTDAPFECGTPITASKCPDECTVCADVCPGGAILGGLWKRGVHRDEFFDVNACKKHRSMCNGLCIASCPYTQAGVEKNNISPPPTSYAILCPGGDLWTLKPVSKPRLLLSSRELRMIRTYAL